MEAPSRRVRRIIDVFVKIGRDMRARRKSAMDSVMALIDERIELNERTLRSIRRDLEAARREIRRLEAQQSERESRGR